MNAASFTDERSGAQAATGPLLTVAGVSKAFTLHLQGGKSLPVIEGLTFNVAPGECVVLGGPSGAGKSSVLKMVYGSYAVDHGRIALDCAAAGRAAIDIATAAPREIIAARRDTIGYVSQFLRVVPRVAALDVVAEPLIEHGVPFEAARERAGELLARLSIPQRLWSLPPATFSGGEQQRVNIARGFIQQRPLLLLDEPTASLDARNRQVVIELIREKLAEGVGILAIFHDQDVRDAVGDRIVDIESFAPSFDPSASASNPALAGSREPVAA